MAAADRLTVEQAAGAIRLLNLYAGRAVGRRRPHLLSSAPPCVHRGESLGPYDGQGGQPVELFGCAAFGSCTTDPRNSREGVMRCQGCTAYVTPSAAPAADLYPGVPDPLPEPVLAAQPPDWHSRPEVRDSHIRAFRRLAEADLRPPPGLSGDGVVILGGGRYWAMAAIACRMLRETGWAGPIQLWHRGGHGEWVRPGDVEGLGVHVIDMDAPPHDRRRAKRGWEGKTHAVLHSGFRRVLYLDADCYPVRDVTPLFAQFEHGPFAYWIDPSCAIKPEWVGLSREQLGAVLPVQGGQLLIDVPAFWRELLLAHWVNAHSDYYYARSGGGGRRDFHIFGDQEAWVLAMAACGTAPRVMGRSGNVHAPGGWAGFSFADERGTVFVHRCGSKLLAGARPLWDDRVPYEPRVRGLFAALTSGAPYGGACEMKAGQRRRVEAEIARRAPCRVLVFGAGSDTACYVHANRGGRTVVLEDDPRWLEAGKGLGAECHPVRYGTRCGDGVLEVCPPLALPGGVAGGPWDVILIDGPYGAGPHSPGRQQPAEAARRLVARGGVVLAHDCGGGHDDACYRKHLGGPHEVVPGPPDLGVWNADKLLKRD